MTAPAPASVASTLQTEISSRIVLQESYLEKDDPLGIEMEATIRKLEEADPPMGALLRANWLMMYGDILGFEECIAKARKLGADQHQIFTTQAVMYSNMCFAVKAQSAFGRSVGVPQQNVTLGINAGVACGSFERIKELTNEAEKAKLDLSAVKDLQKWSDAAEALAYQNVSDSDCAQVIEEAGTVLRLRRLFWLDLNPGVISNGLYHPVGLKMRVNVSPKQAAEMSLELADLLIGKNLIHIPFFVAFVGVKR